MDKVDIHNYYDGLILGLIDGDTLADGEVEGEDEGLDDADGEVDAEGDAEGEDDGDTDAEGDAEGEEEGDTEGEADGEEDGDTDGDLEGDTDADGEADGEAEGDTEGEAEGDLEGEAEGDAEGDTEFDGLAAASGTTAVATAPNFVYSTTIHPAVSPILTQRKTLVPVTRYSFSPLLQFTLFILSPLPLIVRISQLALPATIIISFPTSTVDKSGRKKKSDASVVFAAKVTVCVVALIILADESTRAGVIDCGVLSQPCTSNPPTFNRLIVIPSFDCNHYHFFL